MLSLQTRQKVKLLWLRMTNIAQYASVLVETVYTASIKSTEIPTENLQQMLCKIPNLNSKK
jgi:hypothetical protein